MDWNAALVAVVRTLMVAMVAVGIWTGWRGRHQWPVAMMAAVMVGVGLFGAVYLGTVIYNPH